jgi:hypothetical protein
MNIFHIGSSLSVRRQARFGSRMSVLDQLGMGSTLSVRGFARLGSSLSTASDIRIGGKLDIGGAASMEISGGNLVVKVGTNQAMTMTSSGGTLHGTWTADNAITTSDRRKKFDINPLKKELIRISREMLPVGGRKAKRALTSQETGAANKDENAVMDVLQELRPVSFKYKQAAESKYSRFGFIAQEIEEVFPSIVHRDAADGMLSLRLDDLIAVITLGIQSMDQRVWHLDGKLSDLKKKVDTNYLQASDRMKTIETVIRKLVIGRKKAELHKLKEELKHKEQKTQNATLSEHAAPVADSYLAAAATANSTIDTVEASWAAAASLVERHREEIKTEVAEVFRKNSALRSEARGEKITTEQPLWEKIRSALLDRMTSLYGSEAESPSRERDGTTWQSVVVDVLRKDLEHADTNKAGSRMSDDERSARHTLAEQISQMVTEVLRE